MSRRIPLTWLVISEVKDRAGSPVVLFGRASYDGDADVLTVTARDGLRDVAEVRGYPMQQLARIVLSSMLRDRHRQA